MSHRVSTIATACHFKLQHRFSSAYRPSNIPIRTLEILPGRTMTVMMKWVVQAWYSINYCLVRLFIIYSVTLFFCPITVLVKARKVTFYCLRDLFLGGAKGIWIAPPHQTFVHGCQQYETGKFLPDYHSAKQVWIQLHLRSASKHYGTGKLSTNAALRNMNRIPPDIGDLRTKGALRNISFIFPEQKQTKIRTWWFSKTQAQPVRSTVDEFWRNPTNKNEKKNSS